MPLAIIAVSEGGGFNPLDPAGAGGFLWTLIIFLASLPFLWKVVLGPVARALSERDGAAAKAIEDARLAGEQALAAKVEVEKRLAEARAEAGRMVQEARARAEVRERELLDQARGQAEALLAGARTTIRAEEAKALSAIRDQVVDLSMDAASRVLGRRVDSADDRRMVSDLVGSAETRKPR